MSGVTQEAKANDTAQAVPEAKLTLADLLESAKNEAIQQAKAQVEAEKAKVEAPETEQVEETEKQEEPEPEPKPEVDENILNRFKGNAQRLQRLVEALGNDNVKMLEELSQEDARAVVRKLLAKEEPKQETKQQEEGPVIDFHDTEKHLEYFQNNPAEWGANVARFVFEQEKARLIEELKEQIMPVLSEAVKPAKEFAVERETSRQLSDAKVYAEKNGLPTDFADAGSQAHKELSAIMSDPSVEKRMRIAAEAGENPVIELLNVYMVRRASKVLNDTRLKAKQEVAATPRQSYDGVPVRKIASYDDALYASAEEMGIVLS